MRLALGENSILLSKKGNVCEQNGNVDNSFVFRPKFSFLTKISKFDQTLIVRIPYLKVYSSNWSPVIEVLG